MRSITLIAIIAAAAVGVIASVVFYSTSYGYAGTLDWTANPINQNTTGHTNQSKIGYQQVNITINDVKLLADVAETSDQKSKGLSVKDFLSENEAMLFPFKSEREHSFWMMGMKFPIDIIWLDSEKRVVHIEHSLEPCDPDASCPSYQPSKDSLYVLETVAGFATKYNVTEGTLVEFELKQASA